MSQKQILNQGEIIIEEFQFEQMLDFEIDKQINEHDQLLVTALISDQQRDKYIKTTTVGDSITVKIKKTEEIIFTGLVEEINLRTRKNNYFIEIKGISATYNLDLEKKSLSFQETGISYQKLIDKVLKNYSKVDFKDKATDGEKKENLLIQYKETDWDFLKRIASRFNTGLISDTLSQGLRFHFGIPKGQKTVKIKDIDYDISKKLKVAQEIKKNYQPEVKDKDFVHYKLKIRNLAKIKELTLGTKVEFVNQELYVKSIILRVEDGNLVGDYRLVKEKGLVQEELINSNLIGLSLMGQVLEVKQDQIKVHLEIDKEQDKAKAILFKYCTDYTSESNTGFYTMPEVDDHVLLYLPDEQEKNAVITTALRKEISEDDKLADPNIKYFRTKFGKEIAFKEKELVITGKDDQVLIKVNEEEGIEVISSHDVKVVSEKKVKLNAKKAIELSCQGSTIKMDGKVNIQGSKVTIN